ncbi:hypothetical protein SAMN05428975_0959 [Mucilaginibacter sp. OK268]|nr:hypothetical protein [Mucilaginibacter sp. OK268]SDP27622.1 hypothetical protein SAMN05428975_0959 [Mucilaginibacter sp. OK268]
MTITLIDPKSIPKDPHGFNRLDAWMLFPFEEVVEFSTKKLAKLAKAADPWSSSLAVYYDQDEKLYVHGMIDQAIHYQSYLNYEREDKPPRPGVIQVMITGIGILSVMLDYHQIAVLNQDNLVTSYASVLTTGPVAEFLKKGASVSLFSGYDTLLKELTEEEVTSLHKINYRYYAQSLCRILLKIKNYAHGGALLITNDFEIRKNSKHKLFYDRIPVAIEHLVLAQADNSALFDDVIKSKRNTKAIPGKLFDDLDYNYQDIEDASQELNGAVRFVSSLTCIDGLVLLSPRLEVKGFGTLIRDIAPPKEILVYKDVANPSPKSRVSVQSAGHYGTRHQSMIAYCNSYPDSVGFVVSQDGDIRAIKSVNGKIYVWENIKVHHFLKTSKLPKLLKTRTR